MAHDLPAREGMVWREQSWALDRSIGVLKLPAPAHEALTERGFRTIRDLLLLTAGELEVIPRVGMSAVTQIDDFMTAAQLVYASEAGHVLRPGITVLWDRSDREFSFYLTHPDPLVGIGYGPLILNPNEPVFRLRSLPEFTFEEAVAFLVQAAKAYCRVQHNPHFIRSIFSSYAFDLVPL